MASATGPWFQGEKLEAFGAYWAVLAENYAEIVAATLREAVEFAPSLARPEHRESAREDGSDMIRRVQHAIRAGDWAAVNARFEARGAAFATMGVSIEDWSDIVLV